MASPSKTLRSSRSGRLLVAGHRWLGIAGGLLFVAWFLSGAVMIYARMPAVDPADRLSRLPPLDLSSATVSPWQAAVAVQIDPTRVRIGTLSGRPVYRLARGTRWRTVFADSGLPLSHLDPDQALAVARQWTGEPDPPLRYDAYLTEPDQWTLQSRPFLPVHRIEIGDPGRTEIYVSDVTGEVVMETTAERRRWAYVGPVLHWLYFTPLRSHSRLWSQTLLWLALAGCILTLSGLVWGLRQYFAPRRGSPYSGLVRWHHYAGLVFGLFSFGWALSGALSLDPWSWHPGSAPTRTQVEAIAGGEIRYDLLTLDRIRACVAAFGDALELRELDIVQFDGTPYLLSYQPDPQRQPLASATPYDFVSSMHSLPHRLVSLESPAQGPIAQIERPALEAAAHRAMPNHAIVDSTWLDSYDHYYYDRHDSGPLPVLRVKYDDPGRTWLYLEPGRGQILLRLERLGRLNRWLYRGLHSLDLPFLYRHRPLWDGVVIVLLLGGLALSTTTLLPGWQRLRRAAATLVKERRTR